LLQEKVIEQ
jgi:hypothetical protein